jgi:uncharacterized protein (UPF0332 family)
MAFHNDLLVQARHLAFLDKRRPKQANLRRAVSAAYYALFHLLSGESAHQLTPASPTGLAAQVRRAFDHATMRQVCRAIVDANSSLSTSFHLKASTDLREVADAFSSLQDARHSADYDLSSNWERKDVILKVQDAETAFTAWRRVRGSDEANVFLVALLMKRDWPRR